MRLPTLLVVAMALLPRAAAGNGAWGVDGGVALVQAYEPGFAGFEQAPYAHLAVQRSVSPTLWLRSELGYEGFRHGFGNSEAHWLPIALGLRWQTVSDRGLGVYADLCPALFGFRLVAEWMEFTGHGRRSWNERRLVPGVVAGAGLQLEASPSCHVNLGLRFHRSARPASELQPLRQLGFEAGLDWRPPPRR